MRNMKNDMPIKSEFTLQKIANFKHHKASSSGATTHVYDTNEDGKKEPKFDVQLIKFLKNKIDMTLGQPKETIEKLLENAIRSKI